RGAASHFACAYRVASSGATGGPASPPEVTRHSSVPCRPQSPCFWWVNENAFASLQQARPCPTLGRPVHLRGGAPRLRPGTSPHALRIPPHGGHPALRELRAVASGLPWLCPTFVFVPVQASPYLPLSRPARSYPRFWIRRSSFERRRDLNPPESRAAQRTVSFVYSPGTIGRFQFPPAPLIEFWRVPLYPTPNGRMVSPQTSLREKFFDVTIGERIPQIPTDRTKNDGWFEWRHLNGAGRGLHTGTS